MRRCLHVCRTGNGRSQRAHGGAVRGTTRSPVESRHQARILCGRLWRPRLGYLAASSLLQIFAQSVAAQITAVGSCSTGEKDLSALRYFYRVDPFKRNICGVTASLAVFLLFEEEGDSSLRAYNTHRFAACKRDVVAKLACHVQLKRAAR